MAFKVDELETKRDLEGATKALHMDIHNNEAQGPVNSLRDKMRGLDKRNAKGAAIRSRVNWKQVGDKCSR